MDEVIGKGNLLGAKRKPVDVSHLRDKTVMIYFSASWCPPCRAFTPILIDFYKQHHVEKNFEVILCSWDQNSWQYNQYFSKQPWLALPFESPVGVALRRKYNVTSIPSLVVLDNNTKEVLCKDGRSAVEADPTAMRFPWGSLPTNSLLLHYLPGLGLIPGFRAFIEGTSFPSW